MPDYLGKDQRKVKGDDDKDEKPFQGINLYPILPGIFNQSNR